MGPYEFPLWARHAPPPPACPSDVSSLISLLAAVLGAVKEPSPGGCTFLAPVTINYSVPAQEAPVKAPTDGPAVVAKIQREPPGERAIPPVLEKWAADFARRGKRKLSISRFLTSVRLCAADMGWATIDDVKSSDALEWLGRMRETRGWSGVTHDGVATHLRCFGKFLKAADLVPENPLHSLQSSGEVGGEGARALNTDEARKMIATALARTAGNRKAKGDRPGFYLALFLTGLRWEEMTRVRWRDIDLAGRTLTSDPSWSKNKRRMRIPINAELAAFLQHHRGKAAPDDPVFPVVPARASWRQDREIAGIAPQDERGREATAHGARKWLATELDRMGCPEGVTSRILRHFKTITAKHYIDVDTKDMLPWAEKLPRLWPDNLPNPRRMSPEQKSPEGGAKKLDTGGPRTEDGGAVPVDCENVTHTLHMSDRATRPAPPAPGTATGCHGFTGRVVPPDSRAHSDGAASGSFGSGHLVQTMPTSGTCSAAVNELAAFLASRAQSDLALARLLTQIGGGLASNE